MPDMPHATLKPFPHHRICRLVIAWLACLVLATFSSAQQPDTAKPSAYDPVAVPSVHLHNVWRLSPRIISGSEPDSKEAFEELQQLKVTCIMSVDGIEPRIDWARQHGMRYVHIPIGYDGIDRDAQLTIAQLAREIKGNIYVHCHHGKHRGPAAAAILCRADDGRSSEAARAILERAGTGKEYVGLWKDVDAFSPPADNVWLPKLTEKAPVPSTAAAMARIDRHFDNIKLLAASDWQTPKQHADLVLSREFIQTIELFKEAARTTSIKAIQPGLTEAAQLLEQTQREIESKQHDLARSTLKRITEKCTACHQANRN